MMAADKNEKATLIRIFGVLVPGCLHLAFAMTCGWLEPRQNVLPTPRRTNLTMGRIFSHLIIAIAFGVVSVYDNFNSVASAASMLAIFHFFVFFHASYFSLLAIGVTQSPEKFDDLIVFLNHTAVLAYPLGWVYAFGAWLEEDVGMGQPKCWYVAGK